MKTIDQEAMRQRDSAAFSEVYRFVAHQVHLCRNAPRLSESGKRIQDMLDYCAGMLDHIKHNHASSALIGGDLKMRYVIHTVSALQPRYREDTFVLRFLHAVTDRAVKRHGLGSVLWDHDLVARGAFL